MTNECERRKYGWSQRASKKVFLWLCHVQRRRLVAVGTQRFHRRIILEQQECRLQVAPEFPGMAMSIPARSET